jgi:hypothetical protein
MAFVSSSYRKGLRRRKLHRGWGKPSGLPAGFREVVCCDWEKWAIAAEHCYAVGIAAPAALVIADCGAMVVSILR